MAYLILVVAILLVRFSSHNLAFIRQWNWSGWRSFVSSLGIPGKYNLYVLVGGPVLLLLGLQWLLQQAHWGWLSQGLSLLVVLVAMGGDELRQKITAYLADLGRDDVQAAFHDASALGDEAVTADNWGELHSQTLATVALGYFRCYFPVIFWFAVAGAPGALFYRLISVEQQQQKESDAARLGRMLVIMEWLPLRLFGITLALVGNWRATFAQWLQSLGVLSVPTTEILPLYIGAALDGVAGSQADTPALEIVELEELPLLIDRALISWIALFGLLAIA